MSGATRRFKPPAWISEAKSREILRFPVVTEKATALSSYNQVAFYVALSANKFEIARAVEKLFRVQVLSVNTIRVKGKTRRFRNRVGRQNDYKKAIVRIREEDRIDLTVNV